MTVEENSENTPVSTRRDFVAPVKQEYIIPRTEVSTEQQTAQNADKQSNRGMNRGRTFDFNAEQEPRLCNRIAAGESCQDSCNRPHDIAAYMAGKEPELEGKCPVFEEFGKCAAGVRCRYASSHTAPDYTQIVDSEKWEKRVGTGNTKAFFSCYATVNKIENEVLMKMRKKKYQFTRTAEALKQIQKEPIVDSPDSDIITSAVEAEGQVLGPLVDDKAKIDWKGKTYLAPLTTLGNLPFRRVCKEFGVDVTCGEMAMVDQLLKGNPAELALLKRHESETLFGVQICGGHPDTMMRCVEMLTNECQVDFVDVNLGCPIELVFNRGWGSGLINRPPKLKQILSGLVKVSNGIPITAKIRTGVYEGKLLAHKLIPEFKQCGVDLVTLHGRTRQQRYTKLADWDYVEQCGGVARGCGLPFFGNGDIMSYEEYHQILDRGKVDGLMVGRGALIKPWIFTEIDERRHWDISSKERFEMLQKFCNYG